MQSTMMILTTLLAAGALASPFPPGPPQTQQMCNKLPNGPGSDDSAPFSRPHAITADICHQQCQADQNCKSCVFGFSPSEQDPWCMLFRIPGWQVPGQGTNLHVFDRDCSGVPTGKSSHQDPMGEHSSPPSHGSEHGPHHEHDPIEEHHDPSHGPPNQGGNYSPVNPAHAPPYNQGGDYSPVNPAHAPPYQGGVPSQVNPAHAAPSSQGGDYSPVNPAHAPTYEGGVPSQVTPTHATTTPTSQNGGHHERDDEPMCGGAPAGPAGNAPSPMHTSKDVFTEKDCLSLCKKIVGCKA